mmetsp:Transcript_46323/g.110268  ORF Transcript_46323/g.110268 Transcript_46323/m.110268 type:complete len:319 (+) Transcript_46323:70-1026(+)
MSQTGDSNDTSHAPSAATLQPPPAPQQPPASPLIGTAPGGGSRWQNDEDVTNCPLCLQEFNSAFCRKHHCRQCGRVVCDACSQTRLRLPGSQSATKERVCDECKPEVGGTHAASFLEDATERSEIVDVLRKALSETDHDLRVLKEAMSKLGADGSARPSTPHDPSRIDFAAFQEERHSAWQKVVDGQKAAEEDARKLQQKKEELLRNKENLANKESELLERQQALDTEHAEVAAILKRKDELWRERNEVSEVLTEIRRQIMTLEMQRKEHSDSAARRQGGIRRRTGSRGPEAVLIAAGRQDSAAGRQQPSSQRSCAVM